MRCWATFTTRIYLADARMGADQTMNGSSATPVVGQFEKVLMEAKKTYRFGFVLTTAAGNMTRYQNLRKYANRELGVECVWAPIKHYLEPDPFHFLPGPLRNRAAVMREAEPVMRQAGSLDAIMFHAFEPYVLSVLHHKRSQRALSVWSQDNPPRSGRASEPKCGSVHARSAWRRHLRYYFDRLCAQRTDLFLPFSKWAGDVLVEECGIPAEKVRPIHVGLDLELWPYLPLKTYSSRPQILFVGGDFQRKGGDLLLEVYAKRFADTTDLHLVTKQPPANLPPQVYVYTDLSANDPRLRALYAQADLFVLPTRDDMSSWVAMEAMATGRPVITTRMGGIPDIVRHGETGLLIEPDDAAALAEAMETLLNDPGLRRRMGAAGRAVIERDFSAEVSVPRILEAMKQAVESARAS